MNQREPSVELERTIVTVVQKIAGRHKLLTIAPDESLFDAGILDSFGLAELVSALEQAFGIKIPDADLTAETFKSVNQIASYIRRRS